MNNTKGICLISTIPMRREPKEQSEMISQVLFGELVEILESKNNWLYIKCVYDNYEGWIDSKTITKLDQSDVEKLSTSNPLVLDKLEVAEYYQYPIKLLPGSSIYNFNKNDKSFHIGKNIFTNFNFSESNSNIETIALGFVNTPYLWGGRSIYGIDCSGFSQTVFKILGYKIPRDSSQQVKKGETINFISDINTGDLAFFDNEEGEIVHVGIILNKKQIIHASGFVRIDNIDQQGIFNLVHKKYSHKLRVIKRIL